MDVISEINIADVIIVFTLMILFILAIAIFKFGMSNSGEGVTETKKLDSIVITDSKNRVMAIIAEETVIHDDLRIYFCEDEPDFIENGGVIYFHE